MNCDIFYFNVFVNLKETLNFLEFNRISNHFKNIIKKTTNLIWRKGCQLMHAIKWRLPPAIYDRVYTLLCIRVIYGNVNAYAMFTHATHKHTLTIC